MNQYTGDLESEAERVRLAMDMKMEMFATQIRTLGALRDEGLLTEDEFSAKKAELLSEL
jgi:hypothetical protein